MTLVGQRTRRSSIPSSAPSSALGSRHCCGPIERMDDSRVGWAAAISRRRRSRKRPKPPGSCPWRRLATSRPSGRTTSPPTSRGRRAPFEVTATLFYSRIDGALAVRETGRPEFPIAIVNVDGLTRTRGHRIHRAATTSEGVDLILTHMFLWSTEPGPMARPARSTAQPAARRVVRSAQGDRPGADRLRGVLHGPAVARGQSVSRSRVSPCACTEA